MPRDRGRRAANEAIQAEVRRIHEKELDHLLEKKRNILIERLGFNPIFELKEGDVVQVKINAEAVFVGTDIDKSDWRHKIHDLPAAQQRLSALKKLFDEVSGTIDSGDGEGVELEFAELKDFLTNLKTLN